MRAEYGASRLVYRDGVRAGGYLKVALVALDAGGKDASAAR